MCIKVIKMTAELKDEKEKVFRKNPLAVLVGISAGYPKKTLLAALIVTIVFMTLAANLKIDSSVKGIFEDDAPEEILDFM